MKFKFEFFFFQLMKWMVLSLPLKSAQRLGYYLGAGAFHILAGRRAIALENLRKAFPEKTETELRIIAKGAFRNYGITLVELFWFPNLDDSALRKLVKVNHLDVMVQEHSNGKGMVMLTGHFGSWELNMFALAALSKLPITLIVQTQSNKLVDEVINRHRCLAGNSVIPMNTAVRETIRILNNGGIIGIAPDQSGPIEGVFVDFFGQRVATHQGPAAFALRCSAPMLFGFIIREKDFTYNIIVEKISTSDIPDYNEKNVLELTRRHTALLEQYIRQYPDHWLWMHRRWKHTLESVRQEKKMASAGV